MTSPTKRSLERVFILAISLILISTPAHAYHPKQIESYVKHVYKEKNSCVPRSYLAKQIAEADGYTCEYWTTADGSHRFLKLEKDGKQYEILR